MSLGLCVSPGNVPSTAELSALKPAFLRSVLHDVVFDLDVLLATGLPILLTLNNEADMVAGWAGWERAISYIGSRARGQLIGLTAGNELDVYWSRNENDVPPSFGADLVNRAQAILRPLGIPVGTTSLGGPQWPDYLAQMLQACSPDFVALNPYGWIFDGIGTKIDSVRATAPGLPIKFTELGCKVNDAGGDGGVATALTEAARIVAQERIDASWFAWRDQVGAPDERGPSAFGLVAEDGRRRPAWAAFAALATTPLPVPTPDPAPTPVPVPEPVLAADQAALMDIWQAVRSDVPFNPDAAFCRWWVGHIADMGSPVGPEHTADDGSVWQGYTRGRFKWAGGDEVIAA